MIKSFRGKDAARLFEGVRPRRLPPDIHTRAAQLLDRIEAADVLYVLAAPPSNRLEALKGNRKGQHSIRINQQWRICFKWRDGDAYDVEITDYHK